jgi:hypothetical protein
VITVAGDIAIVAVLDLSGRVRKAIPDRFAASVFLPGAFDLVGRGRRAPQKAGGKLVGNPLPRGSSSRRGSRGTDGGARDQRAAAQCQRGLQQLATIHPEPLGNSDACLNALASAPADPARRS